MANAILRAPFWQKERAAAGCGNPWSLRRRKISGRSPPVDRSILRNTVSQCQGNISYDIVKYQTSADDTLDPQWPFQPVHCFAPQPPVASLTRKRGIGRDLPLAPDAHDTGMHEVNAPLTVKPVEAFHDIVRLARPQAPSQVSGITSPIASGLQGGHCPEPGLLSVAKRLRTATSCRAVPFVERRAAGGCFCHRRLSYQGLVCIEQRANI